MHLSVDAVVDEKTRACKRGENDDCRSSYEGFGFRKTKLQPRLLLSVDDD